MARLIVKSPYIKCGGNGGGSGAGGYLKYIATRERVQIIADDRPPTKRQEQLIRHLLRDFPDVKELDEYDSYETAHTKHAASALISMALEMNWPEASRSEVYLKYIATRPHAERLGAHGLFGDEDGVDLEKLMAELSQKLETVKGKKFYGYLPKSLKPLVDRIVDEMEQLPAVAECYETWWELQCQVNDFYSEQDRQRPPLSKQKEFRAIKNAVILEAELLRSGAVTFEDEGFKLEDEQGDDSGASVDFRYLKRVICDESRSLKDRDNAVETLRGRAWLERAARNGSDCAAYCLGEEYLRGRVVEKDVPKAVVWFTRAAEDGNPYAQYMLGKLYLEGKDVPKDEEAAVYWLAESANQGNGYARHFLDHPDQSPSVLLSVARLLYHMGSIFRDNAPPKPGPGAMSVDRKLKRRIQEKKIAMGHKPDDHEEYQGPSMTM